MVVIDLGRQTEAGRQRARAARLPGRSRLRIALLAPPWLPVPPTGYGGIESVTSLLADALVARGHDVTLLAAPGSRSSARVVSLLDRLYPHEIGASVVEADHAARALAYVERAERDGAAFDVLHDHSGWVTLAMADRVSVPVVHTIHGSFDAHASRFYAAHGHKAALTYISRAQAAARPVGLAIDAIVHNPIDVDAWPTDVAKDDYLLWVGRMCPEKGPHRAIRVARRTGRRLVIAGPVQPGQEAFFAESIEPDLDERITYIGEVGGRRKLELFAGAAAFLMPISWPEPFGMVMVEAMAAGTPVLAFAAGAAPEVVEPGRSGLLVGDEDAMAEAVDQVTDLSPHECRASARERFSPDQIAARYEAVYRAVATSADDRRVPALSEWEAA
jgi:glycosyltransferase involved in cell wall biosynthesis